MDDHNDDFEGLTQSERAHFDELTRIEHDKFPPPQIGRVDEVGLLRRRDGAAYFQGLTPCAYVVRLDDGHVAWGAPDISTLDDTELAHFAAHTASIASRIAAEQLARLVRHG